MNYEHKITKTYEGYSSKNAIIFTGNWEECIAELSNWNSLSRRNGANIVSESNTHFTCDNYDDNGATVKFEII